jgi:hypothetical protein
VPHRANIRPKKQNPGHSMLPGSLVIDASSSQASVSKQRGVSGDWDHHEDRAY